VIRERIHSRQLHTLGALQVARPQCFGEKKREDFPTGGNREMHREEYVDLTLTGSRSGSIPVSRQDPAPSQVDAAEEESSAQEWSCHDASCSALGVARLLWPPVPSRGEK